MMITIKTQPTIHYVNMEAVATYTLHEHISMCLDSMARYEMFRLTHNMIIIIIIIMSYKTIITTTELMHSLQEF